jgi:hypothetical protein
MSLDPHGHHPLRSPSTWVSPGLAPIRAKILGQTRPDSGAPKLVAHGLHCGLPDGRPPPLIPVGASDQVHFPGRFARLITYGLTVLRWIRGKGPLVTRSPKRCSGSKRLPWGSTRPSIMSSAGSYDPAILLDPAFDREPFGARLDRFSAHSPSGAPPARYRVACGAVRLSNMEPSPATRDPPLEVCHSCQKPVLYPKLRTIRIPSRILLSRRSRRLARYMQ